MLYDHDIDMASGVAQEALKRMQKEGIPPAPNNFEVWYVFYANIHPELKAELNDIISTRQKVTTADCYALYEKYLSDRRHQELYQKAGDQIHSTLEDVSGLMTNVRNATTEYTGTLEGVNQKLKSAKSPEDMKDIMASVAKDTAKMMEHNKKLEQQLDQTRLELEQLQVQLEGAQEEKSGLIDVPPVLSEDADLESVERVEEEKVEKKPKKKTESRKPKKDINKEK